MTMRMLPPADGNRPSITINGRTYTAALGSFADMPDADGAIAAANGWVASSFGGAGATAARPASPKKGDEFHDTTLGYTIKFDGKLWRNPTSGAAV